MAVIVIGVPPDVTSTPQRMIPHPLRLSRFAAGLTQAGRAREAGISREQEQRLETGRCVPTWPTARALAAALGCDPRELFPAQNDDGSAANGAVEKERVGGAQPEA